jgi:hypothetical protein
MAFFKRTIDTSNFFCPDSCNLSQNSKFFG